MKTKLKHIFFLSALCLAATACGGSMTKPVSGLDVTLLPTQLLSISPKGADVEAMEQEPSPVPESDTPAPAAGENNQ